MLRTNALAYFGLFVDEEEKSLKRRLQIFGGTKSAGPTEVHQTIENVVNVDVGIDDIDDSVVPVGDGVERRASKGIASAALLPPLQQGDNLIKTSYRCRQLIFSQLGQINLSKNKLECLFQPSLIFVGKVRSQP